MTSPADARVAPTRDGPEATPPLIPLGVPFPALCGAPDDAGED